MSDIPNQELSIYEKFLLFRLSAAKQAGLSVSKRQLCAPTLWHGSEIYTDAYDTLTQRDYIVHQTPQGQIVSLRNATPGRKHLGGGNAFNLFPADKGYGVIANLAPSERELLGGWLHQKHIPLPDPEWCRKQSEK